MADSLKVYISAIESTLTAALSLRNFASQVVERHNKPEVEASMSKELLMTPILLARDERQQCLIEPSINSIRVSIKIRQADSLDAVLVDRFSRALSMRAEEFIIMRRKPMPGFNISFLITNFHLESLNKEEVVSFITQFMREIDAEITSMKLNVNARASAVANVFLSQFF